LKIKVVVIYEPIPESHDVLNKDIAYAVIKLLEGVTEGGSETVCAPLVVVMATTAGLDIPILLEIQLQENRYHSKPI
jgi:hypothetical protein